MEVYCNSEDLVHVWLSIICTYLTANCLQEGLHLYHSTSTGNSEICYHFQIENLPLILYTS